MSSIVLSLNKLYFCENDDHDQKVQVFEEVVDDAREPRRYAACATTWGMGKMNRGRKGREYRYCSSKDTSWLVGDWWAFGTKTMVSYQPYASSFSEFTYYYAVQKNSNKNLVSLLKYVRWSVNRRPSPSTNIRNISIALTTKMNTCTETEKWLRHRHRYMTSAKTSEILHCHKTSITLTLAVFRIRWRESWIHAQKQENACLEHTCWVDAP